MVYALQLSPDKEIEDASSSGSADDALQNAASASSSIVLPCMKTSRRKGRPLPMPHPFLESKQQEAWSLPDQARIFTPPSSPETDPELEAETGGVARLKASDWIKQVNVMWQRDLLIKN